MSTQTILGQKVNIFHADKESVSFRVYADPNDESNFKSSVLTAEEVVQQISEAHKRVKDSTEMIDFLTGLKKMMDKK